MEMEMRVVEMGFDFGGAISMSRPMAFLAAWRAACDHAGDFSMAPGPQIEPPSEPPPSPAHEAPRPEPEGWFDVTKYGAIGDGVKDCSSVMAFLEAWKAACNHGGDSTFFIPEGTFLVGQIIFDGPCHNEGSPLVLLNGTLRAPSSPEAFNDDQWIQFQDLRELHVMGGTGTSLLDGQGQEAWSHPKKRPVKCQNITVQGINISAPSDSPNTDGIHLSKSTNMNITSSIISVGDDCISIGPGNTDVFISNITCGPGHGISVGSLGKYANEEDVVGIRVRNCTINGTTNGVRIKSWPGSPPSKVKLSNIGFRNIRGTSNTKTAVTLVCSSSTPCENVHLRDINFDYTIHEHKGCSNVARPMVWSYVMQAFLAAWKAACDHAGESTFFIPEGTFLVGQIIFPGPCYNEGSPLVLINGTVKAPSSPEAFDKDQWILFQNLKNLHVMGGTGTSLLDGQGQEAWNHSGSKTNEFQRPVSLKLADVIGGSIGDIGLLNSKFFHINLFRCQDISVERIHITAPGDSPNTDGIHLGDSTNINITSSIIGVGDDCISIGPGSNNVFVYNITCGPGHGISIGSLGEYANEKDVVGIRVRNCTINGTTNGVRIKSWPESTPSEVKLSNIEFRNIWGTSNTKPAVTLVCSSTAPCEDVHLTDINFNYTINEPKFKEHKSESDDPKSDLPCLGVKGALNGLQISNFQIDDNGRESIILPNANAQQL
ncbi:Glycoside hydrolase, family 28 [Dillenia turbinata]|uniref:Glycoside hydrolase, family 28 n=1 Tax=Dillenia turbinata TaxID=194707 RepID=A0AAN8VIU5_9MAGN